MTEAQQNPDEGPSRNREPHSARATPPVRSTSAPPRSLAEAWRQTTSSRVYDINSKRIRFGLANHWWQLAERDYTPRERAAISRARHLAADLLQTVTRERWLVFGAASMLSTVVAASTTTVMPSLHSRTLVQILIVAVGSLGFLASGLHRRFNIPPDSLDALLDAALCPQCLGRLEPSANGQRAHCSRCVLEWPATMVRFPDDTEVAKRRPRVSLMHTIPDVFNVPVPFSPAYSGASLTPDPSDPVSQYRTKAVAALLRIQRVQRALLAALAVLGVGAILAYSNSTLWTLLILLLLPTLIAFLFVGTLPRSLIHDWVQSATCPCCDSQLVWRAMREQPGRVRCPTCCSEWISQSLKSLRFAGESDTCPRCRYPLTGLTSAYNITVRCPECALVLSSVSAARCGKCLEPLGLQEGSDERSIECHHCRNIDFTHTPDQRTSPPSVPPDTGSP